MQDRTLPTTVQQQQNGNFMLTRSESHLSQLEWLKDYTQAIHGRVEHYCALCTLARHHVNELTPLTTCLSSMHMAETTDFDFLTIFLWFCYTCFCTIVLSIGTIWTPFLLNAVVNNLHRRDVAICISIQRLFFWKKIK